MGEGFLHWLYGGWTLLPRSQYNVTDAHSETTAQLPHTFL